MFCSGPQAHAGSYSSVSFFLSHSNRETTQMSESTTESIMKYGVVMGPARERRWLLASMNMVRVL